MVKNRFHSLATKWLKKHPNKERKFNVELLIGEIKESGVTEYPMHAQWEKE